MSPHIRCPGCGAAVPAQCRTCPNCDRVLGAEPERAAPKSFWQALSDESPQTDRRLQAAALLGGLYICGLIVFGVSFLLSLAIPGPGPLIGFVLFLCAVIAFVGLFVHELKRAPDRPGILPQKTRRGIFVALVLAGVVCTAFAVSMVALVVFAFAACNCTRPGGTAPYPRGTSSSVSWRDAAPAGEFSSASPSHG